MRSSRAFLFGIGTAYFFDPRFGRRRRNVTRDRGAKALRRLTRTTSRRARFIVAQSDVATDDAVVEQRIRSEVLRNVGVSADDIEVGVDNGIVTLTGEVSEDKQASDLIARVQKVPGVQDVAAMLHVVRAEPNQRAA